jgi:segregation and condensation protein B
MSNDTHQSNQSGNLDPDQISEPEIVLDTAEATKRVEAVLFLSRQPLASRKISQLAGLEDGTQARTMIRELNSRYDQLGQAFHIKRVAGGYQMLTRPQFSRWIRRLDHVPGTGRLSTPALETLTVVAYRQPIIKAEIEAIRGVSCGEMLRQLLEKGLVKIAGRSQELGRPFLYATSRQFLIRYGLNRLSDLPDSAELCGQGLPEEKPALARVILETTEQETESSTGHSETTLLNNDPKEIQS